MTNSGSRFSRILAFLRGGLGPSVENEVYAANLSRMWIGGLVMLPVHAVHAVLFGLPAGSIDTDPWRSGIFWAHFLAAAGLVPSLAAIRIARKRATGSLPRTLTMFFMTLYVAFGVWICLLDQHIAPTPIAYIVAAVGLASILRVTPGRAILLFGAGLAAVTLLLPSVQHNDAYLLSVRVNILTISGIAVILSVTFWQFEGRTIEQRRLIEGQNRELEILAVRDPLTGLYNRRKFMETLELESLRIRRSDAEAGLLLLDLDNFKAVNDTHGHPAGDEVLRSVAQTLVRTVRATDMVARFGGEEFVILLPETKADGVRDTAGRILKALRELVVEYEGVRILPRASCGAALVESMPPDAVDRSIRFADEALYRAKTGGKDRVETAFEFQRQRAV